MKYVFINIKNFARHEKMIFALVILCILSSAIIINFSFGFYHHLEQKKMDSASGTKELNIAFQDKTKVTKGSLVNALCQLDDDVLENCIISFEGRFAQDQTQNAAIDNTLLVDFMPFEIKDGVITVAPIEKAWKENSIIIDGNYFTAEQVENGELVCLASIDKEYEGEEAVWVEKYAANQDGTYTINGKNYTCIGHTDWYSYIPMVPVTTVADDCYIQCVGFQYNNVITRKCYTEITEIIRETYGDNADIPSLNIQEVDSLKFYNALLLFCVFLIGMSSMVLSMLYEYVLLQRRRQLTIYRLCGMTRGKAKLLYFMECLLLSVIIYLCAVFIFHFILLPYLGKAFEYIKKSYSLYSYASLLLLYTVISSVILYIMICRKIGHNVVSDLKEV